MSCHAGKAVILLQVADMQKTSNHAAAVYGFWLVIALLLLSDSDSKFCFENPVHRISLV